MKISLSALSLLSCSLLSGQVISTTGLNTGDDGKNANITIIANFNALKLNKMKIPVAYSSVAFYDQGDTVTSGNGTYASLQSLNSGNDPATSSLFWKLVGVLSAPSYSLVASSTTTLGGVIVPTSGGLAIDNAGNVTLTQAGLLSKMGPASSTASGYLNSTDWANFNGKQAALPAGTSSQYLRGDLTLATFPAIPTPNGTVGQALTSNGANGFGTPVTLGTAATQAGPSGAIVGTTDTQTLTNKTVNGVTPTVFSYLDISSSLVGLLAGKQPTIGYTPQNAATANSNNELPLTFSGSGVSRSGNTVTISGGSSVPNPQVSHTFSAAGSFAYTHNLNTLTPAFTCWDGTQAVSVTATPSGVNATTITVAGAATITCNFSNGSGPQGPQGPAGSGGSGGSGTVTNTTGNLTANAILRGNGGVDAKPSAASIDDSGVITAAGFTTSGSGATVVTGNTGTAPSAPASGSVSYFFSSASNKLNTIDSSGNVSTVVAPLAPVSHYFFTGLGTNGALSAAQPSSADLSDIATFNAAKVGGVTISGTPTAGQVPTATSGTTATWQTPSGGGGSSGPTMTTGRGYFLPFGYLDGGTNGATVYSTNVILQQFKVDVAQTPINKLVGNVTTAVASSNIRFGIYSGDCTTLVAQTPNISGATTGRVSGTLASPLTLAPGIYWQAVSADTAGIQLNGYSNTVNTALLLNEPSYPRTVYGNAPTGSGGTFSLPSSCGTTSVIGTPTYQIAFLP